jgi:hypothetical protein
MVTQPVDLSAQQLDLRLVATRMLPRLRQLPLKLLTSRFCGADLLVQSGQTLPGLRDQLRDPFAALTDDLLATTIWLRYLNNASS